MAGKDATKPFRKNHNERILKSFQYKHLCIGVLADEPVPSDGKTPGRFSRMMSWKKGERSVREVEVNVKEVVMEEKPSVQMVEMTGLAEVKSADPRLEGRGTMDVLAKELAIVAL
jgi:hypothetical protein